MIRRPSPTRLHSAHLDARASIMNPPAPPSRAFHLGAFCCAVLWGFSAAHPPRGDTAAAARLPDARMMRAACPGNDAKPLARTELFFGLARSDGTMIPADEFQRFIDQEVTPRFPEGSTLLGGDGQYRNTHGAILRENAKVLILLYPHGADHNRKIEAARAAYVHAFAQESVLRVDGSACVS